MKLPYQCLQVSGTIIFAAQGANILSFNQDLTLLSTWRHPGKGWEERSGQQQQEADSPAADEPPSKRRKITDGDEPTAEDQDAEELEQSAEVTTDAAAILSKKGKKRKGIKGSRAVTALVPFEKPFILSLNATSDGLHLVAVTGSDKTIWVFEHDGQGHLKLLSHRIMAKRPNSTFITPDNQTILAADKFGDLYALPLLLKEVPTQATPSENERQPSRSATPSAPIPFKPQADETTVHTLRNLKALRNQLDAKQQAKQHVVAPEKPAAAVFEHTLLLGHVSMLTGVLMATNPATDRPYILTSDRDEHIRLSRGVLSQAHIIESYCFGHEEFVSKMILLPSKPRLLVSGGGDDEVFLWDWCQSRLLSKTDVLGHVKKVSPDAEKLAISGLFAHMSGDDYCVFVSCERIPAIFCFRLLDDKLLEHSQTITLPGNPLDMDWVEPGINGLLISLDLTRYPTENEDAPAAENSESNGNSSSGSSLVSLKKGESSSWNVMDVRIQLGEGAGLESLEIDDVKPDELQRALYTVENLRKNGITDD